jgi:hypothetical protein
MLMKMMMMSIGTYNYEHLVCCFFAAAAAAAVAFDIYLK